MKQAGSKFGKKGIVRDKKVHKQVLRNILDFSLEEGYAIKEITYSPITGGEGNIEFLAHLFWSAEKKDNEEIPSIEIEKVVEEAHRNLH